MFKLSTCGWRCGTLGALLCLVIGVPSTHPSHIIFAGGDAPSSSPSKTAELFPQSALANCKQFSWSTVNADLDSAIQLREYIVAPSSVKEIPAIRFGPNDRLDDIPKRPQCVIGVLDFTDAPDLAVVASRCVQRFSKVVVVVYPPARFELEQTISCLATLGVRGVSLRGAEGAMSDLAVPEPSKVEMEFLDLSYATMADSTLSWALSLSLSAGYFCGLNVGGKIARTEAVRASLSVLWLTGSDVTDDDLARIGRAEQLQELNITSCSSIGLTGFKVLEAKLRSLVWLLVGFASLDASKMSCILNMPALRRLHLTKVSISGVADKDVVSRSAIRDLKLKATTMSSETFASIAGIPSIESLSLAACQWVTPQDMAAVGRMSGLRDLSLDHTSGLTTEGLARLSTLKCLAVLNLSGCKSINESVAATFEELGSLRELIMRSCRVVGDQVCQQLAKLRLQRLDISNCRDVTPNGLKVLLQMETLSRLVVDRRVEFSEDLKNARAKRKQLQIIEV